MKILAVDDDDLALDLLEALMDQVGNQQLAKASSAADALGELAEHEEPFDLFLLDINMPGVDGIELCRIIRDMPAYKRTPILMITSMADRHHIEGAFAAGATDYLTKPFEVSELRGRIQVIETLLAERKTAPVAPMPARDGQVIAPVTDRKFDILEPIPIEDVRNTIEYHSLENYAAQLTRKSLFGSSVMAFKIVDFERLHRKSSSFDLGFAITDTAEAISDALSDVSFLMAYAGDGTFVAIIEGGARPTPRMLERRINQILLDMDLHFSDGNPQEISVHAGDPIRMISKVGARAVDVLSEAQLAADKSCKDALGNPMGKGTFWDVS